MGLEQDKRQQSALAMLLEGASYREIAQTFDIPRSEAVTLVRGAVDGLELFLDCLGSIEMMQREQDQKIERLKNQHRLQTGRCGKGGARFAEGAAGHDKGNDGSGR